MVRKELKRKVPPPKPRDEALRFVRLVTAPWHDDDRKLRSNLYGLTEDGRVFACRFNRDGSGSWQELKGKFIPEDEYDDDGMPIWR